MIPTATFLKSILSRLRTGKANRGWQSILCVLLGLFLCLVFQNQTGAQPQPEDSLLFREGEILFSRGETEKALWRFKRLTTEFPNSPLLHEAKFRMGICYTELKRPKDAIQVLNELFSTFLSPYRMIQVFTLLGDNHLALKDRFAALHWYGKGLLIPAQPNEELKKKVKVLIDTFESDEELNKIESLYRGAYGGGYAKLKLAQKAKRQGIDPLARKILTELEREYREMDYLPQAKELIESIPPAMKSKYTVGVILPLSGEYQTFGQRALQGIQLAMGGVDAQGKSPLITLAIHDSKGNPAEAEKAVEELVVREKAIAIIGPLLSITVERAVKKAQQLKTPLLTLSQKEPVTGKNDFIFQNSLTPSEQVQTLVNHAIQDLGLRTFAVFYPNSPYGLHFKNLFTQEVTRKGRKVLGVVAYQENQTDFGQEIKGFFKMETIQKYDPQWKKEEEFKPNLSVDGLFIPDTDDRAGLLLAQMAFYDIQGVTFLGTNAWNGPGLVSIGRKASEGAFFVDAFFKRDPSPVITRFLNEFRNAYKRDPDTLEALSYDGAKLLKDILLSRTISSPLHLRDELLRIQTFQGVSGLRGFEGDGKAARSLVILKVNRGQVERLAQ